MALFAEERDRIEAEFIEGALHLLSGSSAERSEYTSQCFKKAVELEKSWMGKMQQVPDKFSLLNMVNNFAWNKFNREAGVVI